MDNIAENNLLVCKACGYKIKSRNLKTVCPACGVDKKFFVPFTDNISQVRRTVLGLHLHPVVVHFSVAISVILFLTILVSFFTGGKVSEALKGTLSVISIVLPFFVAAGLVSGIIDGIARFKKVKRPALLKKIYLSIGFLMKPLCLAEMFGIYSGWGGAGSFLESLEIVSSLSSEKGKFCFVRYFFVEDPAVTFSLRLLSSGSRFCAILEVSGGSWRDVGA